MEPFTAAGLAKIEGILTYISLITAFTALVLSQRLMLTISIFVDENIESTETESDDSTVTQYRLAGMIVHSGQANGGHYYSYIIKRFI